MTEFAMIANAISYAQAAGRCLWVRAVTAAGDAFRGMNVGDTIIPLLEPTPYRGDAGAADFAAASAVSGLQTEALEAEYRGLAGDKGCVPYLLKIVDGPRSLEREGVDVVEIGVAITDLPQPLPGDEFLRLRALDDQVAAAFSDSAPLLRVTEVTSGLAAAVRDATSSPRDETKLLRSYSVVEALTDAEATAKLVSFGRPPSPGDRAFLIARTEIAGLAITSVSGSLLSTGDRIARSPQEVREILIDAQRKATVSDAFTPEGAIQATDQIIGMIQDGESIRAIDDVRDFRKFAALPRLVTAALTLQKRPLPDDVPAISTPQLGDLPSETLASANANLAGLTVEAVLDELPSSFSIDRHVVAAAVTALRSGKHLLLGGPPGTGKTTLAEALSRAVVQGNYRVATATADWTTFDTIGGYLPDGSDGLRFSPGVVLRSLRSAGWLIIDEVNRADIDKAFGPLFTVLSGGSGSADRTSVLPYTTEEGPVLIKWSNTLESGASTYSITPNWRLIGTLNLADKASLFRLSFAFLRRFAVIDVPLPDSDSYRRLFQSWLDAADVRDDTELLAACLAVTAGPIPIGPAIGEDLAEFVLQGIAPTASDAPAFESALAALAVAIRLFIVPQYEGQPGERGEELLARLKSAAPSIPASCLRDIRVALEQVALM